MERSQRFKDKTVASEGYTTVRGRRFFRILFTDGCAELLRTDDKTGAKITLCFPGEQAPNQLAAIKEAVERNFDPTLLTRG